MPALSHARTCAVTHTRVPPHPLSEAQGSRDSIVEGPCTSPSGGGRPSTRGRGGNRAVPAESDGKDRGDREGTKPAKVA